MFSEMYHVVMFMVHPYEEQIIYSICYTDISYVTPVKVYTRKYIVFLETII